MGLCGISKIGNCVTFISTQREKHNLNSKG